MAARLCTVHRSTEWPDQARPFGILQNPTAPGEFFEVAATADASRLVMARSPHFIGIINQRAYLSRTLVLDENKQVISTHDQWIWFEMPAQMRSAYATKVFD